MARKIHEWEHELWSYVSSSDGMHCPLVTCCQARREGIWCPNDNLERVKYLLDDRRFKPSAYDFVRPTDECRIIQLIEILTKELLSKGDVCHPPVPANIVSLFDERNNIELRLLPLKGCCGAIWRLRDDWVIQLNKNHPSARRRFTLFHEAFHILAHCRAAPVFRKRGSVQGSFNEWLADSFAAHMLAPREWLKENWVKINDLNRVARIFNAPKSVVYIRLKRLGFI